jgi:uncharacterized protein YndB with AHSA1/START domain
MPERTMGTVKSDVEREIVLSRVVDAPRKMVWEAWTDPKHVAKWWGLNRFSTTIEEMHVRPGGVWKQVIHGPDGTAYPNESVFVDVVQYEGLVYTLTGGFKGGSPVKMEKTTTFEGVAGGTRVTMRPVFDSAEARDQNVGEYGAIEDGKQTLERLADYLTHSLAGTTAKG